jgi:hypothetical protein
MVFSLSGGDIVQVLPLKRSQTLELTARNDQERDVEVFQEDKKATSVVDELTSEQKKEETSISTEEPERKQEEEEITTPAGGGLREEFGQEATGEEDRELPYEEEVARAVPTVVVTVRKGDTIHGILKRRFGKSGKILTDAVRELNPEIEDLNSIRVGQEIRLPLNLEVADQIRSLGRGLNEQSEEKVQREHTTESF